MLKLVNLINIVTLVFYIKKNYTICSIYMVSSTLWHFVNQNATVYIYIYIYIYIYEKFRLLVTDVPFDLVDQKPPVSPERSGNHLIDKEAIGIDWKHTSSSWLNRNTKLRVFKQTQSKESEVGSSWENTATKATDIKAGRLQGEGFLFKNDVL